MILEPVFQGAVNAGLPALAAGVEPLHNILRQTKRYVFAGRGNRRAASRARAPFNGFLSLFIRVQISVRVEQRARYNRCVLFRGGPDKVVALNNMPRAFDPFLHGGQVPHCFHIGAAYGVTCDPIGAKAADHRRIHRISDAEGAE